MAALSYDDARALALEAVTCQPSLRLPLDSADGHLLAESVLARVPLPAWTSASMDGFAVRSEDLGPAESVAIFRVVGGGHAGGGTPPLLAPGTAWRVATGGRIPANADSVVRQEDTARDGELLRLTDRRDVGRNVRPEGDDIRPGTLALSPGTRIHPGTIALLAALGVDHPLVIRRPRVAILASGDELSDVDHPDQLLSGECTADANTPMLTAMVRRGGGVALPLPLARDTPAAIQSALEGANDADFIVTAGGVSVGAHDYVPTVMAELGATTIFRRVAIRPGGPVTMARLPDGRCWLALPGNPVSAWVTSLLFALPILGALVGDPSPGPGWLPMRLGTDLARHPTLELFPRVVLDGQQPPLATVAGRQESWFTSGLARADGIVRIPSGTGTVRAGSDVIGMPR